MRCNVGTDIVEIARIEQAIEHRGERFLKRVYTDRELALFRNSAASLAARFAGKEAVIKALHPQYGYISWKCVEIVSEKGGKPLVNLSGRAKERAGELGISVWEISLSHSKEHAIAFVVGIVQ